MTEIQEDVFAADYIMGETTFMKGIIDTATDFISIERDDCSNCEGLGYKQTLNTQIEEYSSWVSYGQYEFYG